MGNICYPPLYNPDDYINDKVLELYPGKYMNYGLYFDLEELTKIKISTLKDKNIKELMVYADAITRRYAKNPLFLDMQLKQLSTTPKINNINVTGIGNIAFMYYHNQTNKEIERYYLSVVGSL